ncbi:saccharopine dehydrogenase NADP-binding domain-containing protein [Rhodocaloribacter litoris]|uniref:saccharopine dehydrogenase family protein n=1 Tax=Rhodocaloribacter litoris TaxID=2558931 RepID=UPI00142414CE|nr:saccharopine dehydrogenase C-terminal domain-containing protein [Rhodocaloribacter litoris]QXD17045.1 saccharopine dehydrogenase NADP-binding domain-containing protein [Rhodocaloribacter litoris]
MANLVVLGAGMVGRAIARDLARTHTVTAVDVRAEALERLAGDRRIRTRRADLADPAVVRNVLDGADLVVCAVPGFMGFATLRAVIEAGHHVVDISFFPENALDLDAPARERGVTALVDMGVAPGMDHLILGHHDARMTVHAFECLVGGLPKRRVWPFEYKAPFSPVDVIEEYTRPARYVEHGQVVVRPALSDPELVTFDEVGTLEAFNTDGLRSLLFTMRHIPNMKEKTLRYPGHIRLIEALRTAGFFDETPLRVGEATVTPREVTSRILFDAWRLDDDEDEFTVMRVTVRGEEDGHPVTHVYHLYDERDPVTGLSSMARTTGFTATAAVHLLLEGRFTERGVFPPELVGRTDGCFDFVRAYLAEREVHYRHEVHCPGA